MTLRFLQSPRSSSIRTQIGRSFCAQVGQDLPTGLHLSHQTSSNGIARRALFPTGFHRKHAATLLLASACRDENSVRLDCSTGGISSAGPWFLLRCNSLCQILELIDNTFIQFRILNFLHHRDQTAKEEGSLRPR